MSGTDLGATLRRRLLGLGLLLLVAAFLAVTILKFDKVFEPVVRVSLHTDKVGNQLLRYSDVKLDGVLVGEVRRISATTYGANLELAIQPVEAKKISENVTAMLLPKTLFGEKYVALQRPRHPSGSHLSDGDQISQDRSEMAIETEKALNDLMPVLRAVQPRKLSATLTALSTALRGRGEELGDTLDRIGRYVERLNPHLPALEHDLSALADVSRTYSDAVPHLANALDDLVTTSRTFVQQRAELSKLYASLTTTSRDLGGFLRANEHNLISVASSSKPTLRVLARYAPEYPCLFASFADAIPKINKAFGKGTNEPGLHATIEITNGRGPYKPGKDAPEYDENRGPRCYRFTNAPNPFPQTPPDGPIQDGASQPTPARSHETGLMPEGNITSPQAAPTVLGLPNSGPERHLIAALVGPQVGVDPRRVPGWASALLGPVYRGSEVTVR